MWVKFTRKMDANHSVTAVTAVPATHCVPRSDQRKALAPQPEAKPKLELDGSCSLSTAWASKTTLLHCHGIACAATKS